MNKKSLFSLGLLCILFSQVHSQIVDVVMGLNHEPITEIQFTHDGTTTTQTAGTTVNTVALTAVDLIYIEINGTTQLFPYDVGNIVRNNNFDPTVMGVGIYEEGNFIDATDPGFDSALADMANSPDLMQFLYYDAGANLPPNDDFDIAFARGFVSGDYVVIGERNGNTDFSLAPLDEFGNVIANSDTVRFGEVVGTATGNGTTRYDWDIGYAPTNITNQSMIYTVIEADLFNIGSNPIYGFRVDNLGDADVKVMGLTETNFDSNPINSQIGGISGNVFNDNDALMDATVNGPHIATPSGVTLYANLYDPVADTIIASMPINTDGTFQFLALPEDATYAVSISTNEGIIGSTTPAQNLPSNWMFTGDNDGTTSGNDGTVDGMQNSIPVTSIINTEINFGIQQLPEADDYNFVIGNPDANSSLNVGSGITSDLSGTDPEDGTLGSTNKFGITSLPANGNDLVYNGVTITVGEDGINPISETNPFIIDNYDPSLFEIVFNGNPAQTSTTFNYVVFDEADVASPEAEYMVSYAALPVEWLYFNANEKDRASHLTFATASETNNSHFEIERSIDGRNYNKIGQIEGKNNSAEISEYEFTDNGIYTGGSFYYRIKQVDFDGKYDFTQVEIVSFDKESETILYPNPVSLSNPVLNIQSNSLESIENATIYNTLGFKVMDIQFDSNSLTDEGIKTLDVKTLTNGTYILSLNNQSENIIFTVVK